MCICVCLCVCVCVCVCVFVFLQKLLKCRLLGQITSLRGMVNWDEERRRKRVGLVVKALSILKPGA